MWRLRSAGGQKPSSKANNEVIEMLVGVSEVLSRAIEERWTYAESRCPGASQGSPAAAAPMSSQLGGPGFQTISPTQAPLPSRGLYEAPGADEPGHPRPQSPTSHLQDIV